ncbi:STE/STE20/YSK protein kinase [Capronia coronata CBS 617.96]|uniref:non-specific serine/threonine protein kinase n=1 Tax=Capronia coronata CBS 617.96 TaxID=1182541 RepID=W9YMX7_9EURO|nr:STE/STE20/YSK protein kinase [Capronia coronata CBS 617.96]EXJ93878.1 STE/STE20/YSK protein kinase [Capronia coronata CBS 617.96]
MASQYSETAPHQARATQSQPPSQSPSHFEIQDDQADGETLAARYQMLEELGSGSFGVVYKAIEKATGEIVAIKHVDLESSEEDLSDILSELSVLSSCASPYVTKYRLAFLRRQTLWIVMEYLGGGSCADLLKPPPHCLSESHIAIICRELLLGLAYLHREGKLHRDIKAANILLGMDGRVKLADFGVAAQLVGLKSVRNTFVGTPFWMAPEVIQQEGHDAKADIWSLGITAMELANGEPPHANVHPMKVLFLIPKQPAPRLEGNKWSRDFRDFVASCLTKDVDKRSSAKDLLKHRFIRSAGKIEGLQELIVRKQDWEASKGGDRHLKYYAETLRSLSSMQNDDDWVFETIKAVPTVDLRAGQVQTQKRRKVDRSWSVDVRGDLDNTGDDRDARTMDRTQSSRQDQDRSPSRSTMRKISNSRLSQLPDDRRGSGSGSGSGDSPTTARRTARKRLSSAQARQPLGVNMSFGNSPSTVRQFRRVSPHSNVVGTPKLGNENEDDSSVKDTDTTDTTGSVIRTPSKAAKGGSQLFAQQDHLLDSSTSDTTESRLSDSDARDSMRSSSSATTAIAIESTGSTEADSKEATLGRRLYSTAIGISCQDVLDETADETKREAVARLAEAFSDLENVDPDGMYHVMAAIVTKMKQDPVLLQAMLLPLSEDGSRTQTGPQVGSGSTSLSSMQVSEGTRKDGRHEQPSLQLDPTSQSISQSLSQPQPAASASASTSSTAISGTTSTSTSTSISPPISQPSSTNASRQVTPNPPASGHVNGAKLVLAQNNPHLKSHRRRQSAQTGGSGGGIVKSREASRALNGPGVAGAAGGSPLKKGIRISSANVGSPRSKGDKNLKPVAGHHGGLFDERDTSTTSANGSIGEKEKETDNDADMMTMMDGLVGGLDHTRQLADVLFERWCEGLRLRWPAV